MKYFLRLRFPFYHTKKNILAMCSGKLYENRAFWPLVKWELQSPGDHFTSGHGLQQQGKVQQAHGESPRKLTMSENHALLGQFNSITEILSFSILQRR